MFKKAEVTILLQLKEGRSTFTELVDAVGNKATTSSALKGLRGEGLLRKVAGAYGLTQTGAIVAERVGEIRQILESPGIHVDRVPHPAYRDLLRVYAGFLLRELGERLVALVLFGSVARGTWDDDSDIDLIVVAKGFEDPMAALDQLLDIKFKLKDTAIYRRILQEGWHPAIQHYPLSPDDRPSRLLLDVVTEGIVLYDRGGFGERMEALKEWLASQGSYRVERPDGTWYWVLGGAIGEKFGGAGRPEGGAVAPDG